MENTVYDPDSGFRPPLWLSLTLGAAWLTNAPAAIMIHYSAAGLALLLAVILVLEGGHKPGQRPPVTRPSWMDDIGLDQQAHRSEDEPVDHERCSFRPCQLP